MEERNEVPVDVAEDYSGSTKAVVEPVAIASVGSAASPSIVWATVGTRAARMVSGGRVVTVRPIATISSVGAISTLVNRALEASPREPSKAVAVETEKATVPVTVRIRVISRIVLVTV